MPYFHLTLKGPRPTFAFDMTEDEKQLMQRHIAYWMELIAARTAVVFGPVLDPKGPWGMGILEAADEVDAQRIIDKDPVMQAGIGFNIRISPMRIGAIRGEMPAAPATQTN
jgi:uncharacterized protein YciI